MNTKKFLLGVSLVVIVLGSYLVYAVDDYKEQINAREKETQQAQTLYDNAVKQLQAAKIAEYTYKLDQWAVKDIQKYKENVSFLKGQLKRLVPDWKDKYRVPSDLFYTFLVTDNAYVSQSDRQHYGSNGFLGTDVATGGRSLLVYAPDYKDKEIVYIATTESYPKTTGDTVILTAKDNNFRWLIGHTKATNFRDGDEVKTGYIVGKLDLTGATTGYHSHVQFEVLVGGTWQQAEYRARDEEIHELYNKETKVVPTKEAKVYMTTYTLGDVHQNDNSPCVGASGKNLCEMVKHGDLVIALTADIRNNLGVKFGDKVLIIQGVGSIEAYVEDEMAIRFRKGCISKDGACIKADLAVLAGEKAIMSGVVTISKP